MPEISAGHPIAKAFLPHQRVTTEGKKMGIYKFFMFDPDSGFETYKTADEAKAAANEAIDYYRGDAGDGWPDEVSQVCWGEIKQETQQTDLRPRNEEDKSCCEMICDYQLTDI